MLYIKTGHLQLVGNYDRETVPSKGTNIYVRKSLLPFPCCEILSFVNTVAIPVAVVLRNYRSSIYHRLSYAKLSNASPLQSCRQVSKYRTRFS